MQRLYKAGNPTILPISPALAILHLSRHLLHRLLQQLLIRASAAANFPHLHNGFHLTILQASISLL